MNSKILIVFFVVVFTSVIYAQEEVKLATEDILNMSLEELMNIEVYTAGKTFQKVSDIPASVVTVTREEIEKYGYISIEEILQNIPGLYGINDYGEGGMIFGVRGFWSSVPNDNIIILIDNVPQTKNVFSNHPIIQIPVPVEAIERIEVVRGPMSVIYGSGAFFGAINIITEAPKNTNKNNIISGSIGTSETKKVFLRLSDNENKLKYTGNISYISSNGIDQPASKLMSDVSKLNDWGVTEDYRTGGKLDHKRLFFNFKANLSNFYFTLAMVESVEGIMFDIPSYGDGHKMDITDFILSAGYRKDLSKKVTIDGRVTYSKDRIWFQYDFLFEDFYGIQQVQSKAVEADFDVFVKLNPKLDLTAGFHYKSIFTATNMYDLPSFGDPFFNDNYIYLSENDQINSLAFYAQADYRPFKNLQLIAGARIEKSFKYDVIGLFSRETEFENKKTGTVNSNKAEFIPRFAGIYKFNKNNILKFLYGKAITRPSFFQNYLQIVGNSGRDLKSEKIETFELNYNSALSSKYSLNISFFHNNLENLITRVIFTNEIGMYDSSYFANAGKMVTNGFELSVMSNPFPNLFFEISGTYQKAEDKRSGYEDIDVAYSPQVLGYLKIRYQLNRDISIAINGNYVGSMESLYDETPEEIGDNEFAPIGRIGEKVDSYFNTGLNLRYQNIFLDGIYVNIKISNLFDTDIRYPTFNNNRWADLGTLDNGRELLFSVGYKF